jgi:hypothetical protein
MCKGFVPVRVNFEIAYAVQKIIIDVTLIRSCMQQHR